MLCPVKKLRLEPELANALLEAKGRKLTLVVAGRRGCGKTKFICEHFLKFRPQSDVYALEFDRKRGSHALGFAVYSTFVRALGATYFIQVLEATVDDWTPQKLRASALCAPEVVKLARSSPESFGIVVIQADGEVFP